MNPKLYVVISSPERVEWEGEADAVSSENSIGTFDILPGHANFVTMIEKKPIVIRRRDGRKEYTFNASVIYVRSNNVTVYVNL